MKKFLSLSLFAIISFYSSGQSIVVSTNLWSNIMFLEPSGQLFTEKIKFTTDTMIDLITYKVVERTLDKNQLNWNSYGFMREDANNRVFYKLNASRPEKLLYDLNLAMNNSEGDILIYDGFGRICFREEQFNAERIDVSGFPEGMYILWHSDSSSYTLKKFIVFR